jgi:hypothetical protein
MIKFTVIPKKTIWQFDFIIQKFARLKSKHFSQFFWCEVNTYERIESVHFAESSGLSFER